MASQGLRPAGAVVKTGTTPAGTPVAWAIAFLKGIGAPVTQNNINTILAWAHAESGDPTARHAYGNWSNFNPLNVEYMNGLPNVTGVEPGQYPIVNFDTLSHGAVSSAWWFNRSSGARPVIEALRRNASIDEVNAAIQSFYTWDPSFSIIGQSTSGGTTPISGGGGGTHQATTTSALGDIGKVFLDPGYGLGKALNALGIKVPGSGVLKGVDAVFSFFAGLLNNWRMLVQFLGGVTMMGIGLLLILHDTGVDRKAAGIGGKVVAIGALA